MPRRRFGMHPPNSCLLRLYRVKWFGIRTDKCDFLWLRFFHWLQTNKQTNGSESPPQTVFTTYKAVNLTIFKANSWGIKLSTSPCNLPSSRGIYSDSDLCSPRLDHTDLSTSRKHFLLHTPCKCHVPSTTRFPTLKVRYFTTKSVWSRKVGLAFGTKG
jgi:hypothetical protein